MRRLPSLFLLISGLVLAPLAASAKDSIIFNFRNRTIPGDWSVMQTLQAEATTDGLHVKAQENGRIYKEINMPQTADIAVITVAAIQPMTMSFGWHPSQALAGELIEYSFNVDGTGAPETIVIPIRTFPQWEGRSDVVALGIPKGAELYLQDIQLHRYSMAEKAGAIMKSLWTFDNMRNYSINFLWGPLFVTTPDEVAPLFKSQPPYAWSVFRIIYPLLLIAIVVGILWALSGRTRGQPFAFAWSQSVRFIAIVGVALWLLFDLRMGMELLSYVKDDFQQYVLAPKGQKEFREFMKFHDVIEQSRPYLMQYPQYLFFTPSDTLNSYLRYMTYPSLPARSDDEARRSSIVLVFMRPDITVDAQGTLRQGSLVLAQSGSLIERFDDTSFLYQMP